MVCNLARVKQRYDPVKKAVYRKKWYEENKEKSNAISREYYATVYKTRRKKATPAVRLAYERQQHRENLQYRLRKALRARFRSAVKRRTKTGSAVRDLGCSVAEFIAHIESQFTPSMNWSNWGSVWELDHIKPLASFDLSDQAQCAKAVRFSNLQPLRIERHREKSAAERRAFLAQSAYHQP